MLGIVEEFMKDKGYGFVRSQGIGGRIFFHLSGFKDRADYRYLEVGDLISYVVETNERGLKAGSIQLEKSNGGN